MSRYSREEVQHQLDAVVADLPALAPALGGYRAPEHRRTWLCGNGDSRAAALMVAADPGVGPVEVVHPWELTTGAVRPDPEDLVVLVSASGTSDAVVEAAHTLRAAPAPVLAVTGAAASELARTADHTLAWALGPAPLGPSPAVRTFAATYLALAAVCGLPLGDALTGRGLAPFLHAAGELADWLVGGEVDGEVVAPTYLGTGRHRGAAEFARSKSIEVSGVTAVASDPGEWFHVDRHAAPPFGPLVALGDEAPPAHLRTCLDAALGQGRRVAVVAPGGGAGPWRALDLEPLPALLRPLAGALAGVPVGLRQAALLDRVPFVNKAG